MCRIRNFLNAYTFICLVIGFLFEGAYNVTKIHPHHSSSSVLESSTNASTSILADDVTLLPSSTAGQELKSQSKGVTTEKTMTHVPPKQHISSTEQDLVISSQNMTECMGGNWTLTYRISGAVSVHLDSKIIDLLHTNQTYQCNVVFIPPENHIIRFEFSGVDGTCALFQIHLYEMADETHPAEHRLLSFTCSPYTFGMLGRKKIDSSLGQNILMVVTTDRYQRFVALSLPTSLLSLSIQLSTIPDYISQLELTVTGPSRGFITTPGWDGVTRFFLVMDTQTNVSVPAGHVLAVRMAHIDIHEDDKGCLSFVKIFPDKNVTSPLKVYYNFDITGPDLYDFNDFWVLNIQFKAPCALYSVMGFKLQFVIFPRTQNLLNKLPDGRLNCTTSDWQLIEHFFPCDLWPDCANLKDEENCPYTTARCGYGRVSVGDSCYIYIPFENINILRKLGLPTDRIDTWEKAKQVCRNLGAQLTSINTPQEIIHITDLLMLNPRDLPLFIGMTPVPESFPDLYRDMWYNLDGSIALYAHYLFPGLKIPNCVFARGCSFRKTNRYEKMYADTICELPASSINRQPVSSLHFPVLNVSVVLENVTGFLPCPQSHFTHTFLACDALTSCWWDGTVSSSCDAPVVSLSLSFKCDNEFQFVPYTYVCDHVSDCSDGTDEHFCIFKIFPCDKTTDHECSGMCLPPEQVCTNGVWHCEDGKQGNCKPGDSKRFEGIMLPPPAILTFSEGVLQASDLGLHGRGNGSVVCPDTHFQCADNGYCLPVFTRCNTIYDCPGHEDEAKCEFYTCPGFYRCRKSRLCVHKSHLCDGVFHCPQCDDEILCKRACPPGCTCIGLAFSCERVFPVDLHQNLRYLDASGSGLMPASLVNVTLLVWLSLARCTILHVDMPHLANLQKMDLSDNYITAISSKDIFDLLNLRDLKLTDNPLISLFEDNLTNPYLLQKFQSLDLSRVHMIDLDPSVFHIFPRLNSLNLTGCGLNHVLGDGFQTLLHLRVLDAHGCPLTFFPRTLFQGLDQLMSVVSDNYKLCCPTVLPLRFNLAHCQAPTNEISSCDALLRSHLYRGCLSVFAILAILGNIASFFFRVVATWQKSKTGFDVFVANLCMSDFLMGVYLAMIGVADRVYMGNYLWNDFAWQESAACKTAGMLCLMSTEVSAFVICLITLDRLLVLCFPFSQTRFNKISAWLASGLVWISGLILAVIPLLPNTSHWEFFSQNGICIPLPITQSKFAGYDYAFLVLIVLNFVLFLIIALGQTLIYWSVQKNRIKQQDSQYAAIKTRRDVLLARRLITVALSDFLCWFPVGCLALMAAGGVPVPRQVNVIVAIFVLPINSAINPFLYTLNIFLERRRLQREERILRSLVARIEAGVLKIDTTVNQ